MFRATLGAFVLLYAWVFTSALQPRAHGRFPETFWPNGALDLLNSVAALTLCASWWRDRTSFRRRIDRNAAVVVAGFLVAWNALRVVERLRG